MNYELAKQLKDAGFPQEHHNTECNKNDCYMLPCPNSKPTLEELIEACGSDFRQLARTLLPSESWHCYGVNASTTEVIAVFHGATPSEAVANLYLALHAPK